MKKALIITYYWPPSGGAGVQRWLKFSKYLPKYGWEPIVFAPNPEQATYPVIDHSLNESIDSKVRIYYTRCTELFSVYKRLSAKKTVPHAGFASESGTPSLKQKLGRFVRGNFFLPDPRKGWNRHAIKEIKSFLKNEEIECIITTGPPHSSHLIGLQINKETKIPWIADFRDPWTDIYYYKEFYPSFLAHSINLNLEKKVLKHADRVITVSPAWKELFKSKISENKEKVHVLTNGFDEDDFTTPKEKTTTAIQYITYVGTMSDIYPMNAFIAAFSSILEKHPNAVFRLIGTVSDNQRKIIGTLPPGKFEFIPYVEHSKAVEYMQEAKILLLLIPEHNSSRGIVPGKLFEYFAVGKPILVIGDESGDAAKLVIENAEGGAANNSDSEKIFEIISKNLQSDYAAKPNLKFSRNNITKNLVSILEGL